MFSQIKEKDSEYQSRDNGDTQAKTAPVPSHNVSPPPLKPEASPFYPHQNNTAPHRLVSQQPYISAREDFHEPVKRLARDVRLPYIKSSREHATPADHFRPQNYTQPPYIDDGSSHINGFVRYLARRELVAAGLLQFNGKPKLQSMEAFLFDCHQWPTPGTE